MKPKDATKGLYVSDLARERLLARYEEALGRWKEVTGLELERLRIPTAAGETAVFAFGPKPGASAPAGRTPSDTALSARARPLLLLHGTLSNSIAWMADAATLGAKRRVYAVDIPGEPGLSAETRLDWQGRGGADWLGELVAGLGIAEHDLCGLSIGGWIGLAYAIAKPWRGGSLRSLALLSPSGIGRTRASFILKAMLQMSRGRAGLEAIARSLYGDLEPPMGAIEAGIELTAATNARREAPRIFTDSELAGIEARLFLAVGSKDALLRSEESAARLGRAQPEAEIRILPGAGHALLGLGTEIAAFLDRDPRTAA